MKTIRFGTKIAVGFCGILLFIIALTSNVQGQVSFPGPELLGRPTSNSITVNVVASAAIEAYFEYGTQSGNYPYQTNTVSVSAGEPMEVVLNGLQPNTLYYYRMVYRQAGASTWITRDEHSFYTQRPPGSTFKFTITSDSHINIVFGNPSLWQTTLLNAGSDDPDFHLDLGDTFAMDNVTTQTQAYNAYLSQRPYLGLISHSVPIFLVLGNHEQEEGWHLDDTGNPATSPPVMGANSRKRYFLNPIPDAFYSGDADTPSGFISGDHLPEDYYAWEWGDALFVVIDPFWYTTVKPYIGNIGGGETSDVGSGDRWGWTLGWDQYKWLQQALESSKATFKFVFAHHVTGGTDDYGRGGANAVPYVEWGGYNEDGTTWGFDVRRAGWGKPIHQLMVENGVTAFFHGHDHEFAYEERDGIVYQLVPMAADASYGYGFQNYHESDPYTIRVLPNSGHLRVTVSPSKVTVDYVRAFLPGAGTNGQVAYTYTMGAAPPQNSIAVSSLSLSPNTVIGGIASSTGTVTLNAAAPAGGVVVSLSSSNTSAATIPPSVMVAANATSATFTVTSNTVTSSATSVITATLNGSVTATLTVVPAATGLSSLTLNPTTVVGGGANAIGTVTLNGFALPGGTVVTLSSSDAHATVPANVTVPANATSAAFTVTSLPVTSLVSVTITATLNGSKTATLTVNPAASFAPVRIDSGGPAYTDSLGQRWIADAGFTGGSPYSVTKAVTNTSDSTLYQTARFGTSFRYVIPAPAGKYSVTLKFAELYWTAAKGRVFNVTINGTTVLSNFDIFAAAGAAYRAVDKTFTVASSGTITIQFTQGSAGNPMVNAIQVAASAP